MEVVNKNNSNFLDSSTFDFENNNLILKKELKGLDDKSDIRSKATTLLKERYKNGLKEIKQTFERDELIHHYCDLLPNRLLDLCSHRL